MIFTEGLHHVEPGSDLVFLCAPGRIRTCDTRFRRAVLYPLSYEGEDQMDLAEIRRLA